MILPRREQFSGSLIGQCLGDALGFPVEGLSPEVCKRYVEDVLRRGHVEGRPPYSFGQYSDDSQLARELMESFVTCRGFKPDEYATRIARMFVENRIVGRGHATEQAAFRLARGEDWQSSGTPPPSAGNGSAMRAGPVGLMFFDNHDTLIRVAHDQGRITHKDSRCSAGAVAIAGGVALVLVERPVQCEAFLTRLSEWAGSMDESVGTSIERLKEWIELPPESAIRHISRVGIKENIELWDGISPFVTTSVLWSLYSFLRSPDNYWETILTAIACGGDVDTTAAMAGAISGAYLGIEAIPVDLARMLNDQGDWGFSELMELADRCYRIKMELMG